MKRATTVLQKVYAVTAISIHALVKRATRFCHAAFILLTISIHALVKRATYANFVEFVEIFYFNPRPREEGDDTD